MSLSKADQESRIASFFRQDQNKRRSLLEAIFSLVEQETESAIDWLVFLETPLVFLEDFEWLISCLDGFSNRKAQEAIGRILKQLYMRNNITQLELIYDACQRHSVIAEKFNFLWEPIILDSGQARHAMAQHQQNEERRIRREQSRLVPSPAEQVIAALEKCEAQDSAEWPQLHHALSFEANATQEDPRYKWDVMKLPGWVSADQTIQERIVGAAEAFILLQTSATADWLGTGTWKFRVLSGYCALVFLLKIKPEVLHGLTSVQIEKWCPIIVSFPFLDGEEARAVKDELLKLAYSKSPHTVLNVAEKLLEKLIEKGGTISVATELNGIWDDQVANLLLRFSKDSAIPPKSMGSLLSVLFAHDNADARSFAESLLSLPLPQTDAEKAKAIITAQTLMVDTHDAGWATVWPAIQQDEEFGKQVIFGIGSDYASIGHRLNEEQLADLYVWLTRHFEVPQHPSGEAYHCEPLDYVDMWRNAIIQLLIHRGSVHACAAIRKLQQKFPELDWLKTVQADAEAETRRATWIPARPQDIVKLANDSELRLVQNGDQLLQVLVESLERLQALLQEEIPQAQFLWNNPYKPNATPQDEEAFANYVVTHLRRDLNTRGIVLNREVQIHRKQRTDIHVNAVIPAVSGQLYDSITTIIECKGCWNDELDVAMDDQLKRKYLKDNHCQHGLYLVGWFNCSKWSKDDRRRKNMAEKLCPTLDDTRQRLTVSAADLSKDSIRIKSVVLDTSLH